MQPFPAWEKVHFLYRAYLMIIDNQDHNAALCGRAVKGSTSVDVFLNI